MEVTHAYKQQRVIAATKQIQRVQTILPVGRMF